MTRLHLSRLTSLVALASLLAAPILVQADPGRAPIELAPVESNETEQTDRAELLRYASACADSAAFWRNEARLSTSRGERARHMRAARQAAMDARGWAKMAGGAA